MDWIGFLISIAALIYLYIQNSRAFSGEPRQRKEEVKPEMPSDNPLNEYLKAVEEREARIKAKPAPMQKLRPKPKPAHQHEKIEDRHLISSLKERKLISPEHERRLVSPLSTRQIRSSIMPIYEHDIVVQPSRAQVALDQLHNKQNILIYHEIFGKPKSLQ
jgi:hypothetical protein